MKKFFDKQIGQYIRLLRKKNKLNQQDFASILKIHQTAISRIESGQRSISLYEVYKITDKFPEFNPQVLMSVDN